MASPWTIILAAIALVCVAGGEVTVTDGDAPDVYLAKVAELYTLVDADGDGVLTCGELKYEGCRDDVGEEGIALPEFAGLMRKLAGSNRKDPMEFLEGALKYQTHGVKQEL